MDQRMKDLLKGHEDKYPFQLVEHLPHIAEKIINLWGNTVALTEYFQSLLSTNKPVSQQLSPMITHELRQLADLHKSMQAEGRLSHDMWEATNAHDSIQRNDTVRAKQSNPIFMVAKRGDVESLDKLIKAGTDVDVRDDENRTALMVASAEGHEAFVEALIQKGARLTLRDNDGLTSIHWAVLGGHGNIISILVSKGGDPNASNRFGATPLLQAAAKGDSAIVERLIQAGARANQILDGGTTALHKAVLCAHANVVEILLKHGGDPFAKDQSGNTPYSIAQNSKDSRLRDMMKALEDTPTLASRPTYPDKK